MGCVNLFSLIELHFDLDAAFRFRGYPPSKRNILGITFTKINDTRYLADDNSLELLYKDKQGPYESWSILQSDGEEKVTGMVKRSVQGSHNWTFKGAVSTDLYYLNFNNCSEDYFSCDDGLCLPIEKRCNFIPNCDDESDELNCHLLR